MLLAFDNRDTDCEIKRRIIAQAAQSKTLRNRAALSKALDGRACLARVPHTHFQASRKTHHRVLAVKRSETEGVRHSAENGRN